ncbi:NAD(P)H-dependent oxidoreductase [Candidatus Gracilibacteria bacterium]|nr:NAD(P)H-dependent oxidoreductase [Candidatus Gracilibacteria bacterium]
MKKIILLQPSLRKNSLTDAILREFQDMLVKSGDFEVEIIDLREKTLEFCDGRELGEYHDDIQEIYQKLKASKIVILGFPVYHYAISGVLKNFLDICGEALTEKKVGVIVSALLPECQIAYEHFFESFEKKYSIKPIQEVPYILNSYFQIQNGKLGLLGKGQLQKFVKNLL